MDSFCRRGGGGDDGEDNAVEGQIRVGCGGDRTCWLEEVELHRGVSFSSCTSYC